jgi:hypothetical protein
LSMTTVPAEGQYSKTHPITAGCPSPAAGFHPCALAKAKTFTPSKTPDGQPDLQGIWDAPVAMGFQNIEDFPGDLRRAASVRDHIGRRSARRKGALPAVGEGTARRECRALHRSLRAVSPNEPAADGELPDRRFRSFPDTSRSSTRPEAISIASSIWTAVHMSGRTSNCGWATSRHWEGNTLVIETTNMNGRC